MASSNKRKDSKGRVLRKGESQKEDNLYMYRWTDNNRKRQCCYASTLDKLREKEKAIEKEMMLGVSRTTITLNEQIEIYLQTKNNLAKSTKSNYQYYYEHSIKGSRLGNMKVIDIKKSDILMFYKQFSDGGYSAGTIQILQKIVRPSLQLACDDNVILKNPADGCTKDYSTELEKKYALTFDEEKEFLERIKNRPRMKRYYPMYAIILETGLRISEAIGLTWDDVDMEKRTISINHQVQCRTVEHKYTLFANTTKTEAGVRIIPMTDDVYRLFVEQRKVWLSTIKASDFEVDGYKNFVFVSHVTGKCMNHNNVRRMLRSVVDMNKDREIQLPPISPHILRHTAATRLAESGCDIKVMQYLLGHTDVRTTMRVYNHVDPERVKREMEKLENLRSKIG
ncbi:MAG: site-specific integrase [Lachnospiraceae bacterium]|nr:site-specific integrase [Lachnospiraceae bacterium]MDD7027523.1 site-specific integrase [Lachnospiraceae bacterium]